MNKNLSSIFETTLHEIVDWDVFRRGEGYYDDGAVVGWKISDKDQNIIKVEGTVSGTEEYKTDFEYNLDEYEIISAGCSCPYGYGCKHIVALGLHFSRMLEGYTRYIAQKQSTQVSGNYLDISSDQIIDFAQRTYQGDRKLSIPLNSKRQVDIGGQISSNMIDEREDLIDKLQRLGLPIDILGEKLIDKLLVAKREAAEKSVIIQRLPLIEKPKNTIPKEAKSVLSEYYIRLDEDLTPHLSYKNIPYMMVSIKETLKKPGLSESQTELLNKIKEGVFDGSKNKKRDILHLVELIRQSEMLASVGYSYDNIKPINFVIENTKKLKAKINFKTRTYYDEIEKQYFTLSMPDEYWRGNKDYYGPFAFAGDYVIHTVKQTVTIYPIPSLLSQIIERVRAHYSDQDTYSLKLTGSKDKYETELTGEEMWRYDEIIQLASEHLDLSEKPPQYNLVKSMKAVKSFVVDYNAVKETLDVKACIDYGLIKQNVGESVHISMSGGVKHFAMRNDWGNVRTHRILVEGDVIGIAKIDEKKEIDFYKEIRENSETIGFSKTLKFDIEGQSKIIKYLRTFWPELHKYAKAHEYPIVFTKDKLHFEEAHFRADFDINLDADNDWLHFDMECYCGRDKLTLPQIMQFIETGETVFQKEDGTFVEISNRQELERLIAMLKSFEAREGGFRGRLYHAAELEYIATSSEHYTVARAKSFNKFIRNAYDGKPVKSVRIPGSFDKVLRPYQKEGVQWLHFLRSFRFAGILADDMGIGKTLQALTILSSMRSSKYPSLVICPKSLLFNWKNEVELFAPELKTLIYEGGQETRSVLAKKMKQHDLVVVSYATFKRDESKFVDDGIRFNYVVLDEAQFIKNHATKGAQIAKKVNADYRLALTGTPLENNVSELWSIFDFLMPGFLGNYKDFRARFHKPIMDGGDRLAIEHLRRKIAPFMLRRTKSEVLTDLPAKIEQEVVCELGKAQNVLYQQILAKVRGEVFAAVNKKGFNNAQIHILAGLMKLRQVCNHPALLLEEKGKGDNWKKYESAKLELAKELVYEAVKGGHKVLIFSQFTSMLDIIGKSFDADNISYLYLSGRSNNRGLLVKQFNEDPKISVFLISLKAGGTGLNLTSADTVIIFDPWWNPSVEAQAADRAHRIGQKKTVNVYRLLTKGTIEDKIQNLKKKKKSLSDALVDSSRDMFNKLTWDDVRELFD